MKPPLNLRQVECFVAAADAGTMTTAAQRLRVSQSAISVSVAQLENALGAQLLIRRRSLGLTLTDAGRAFLPAARELLAHADAVRDAAGATGTQVAGRLVVGCFRTAAPYLLPELLETFAVAHPQVQLDFIEGPMPEIETALREGRCELALVYDLDVGPGITCEPIYQAVPYLLFAPDHPLAGRDAVAIEELDGPRMVMLDVPPSVPYFERIFAASGRVPDVRYRTSSYELVRALVARGLGYGMLISRPFGDRSYEGLPLVVRPLAGTTPPIDVALARTTGVRETRRAAAFADHCRRTLPASAGGAAAAGQLAVDAAEVSAPRP
jgi:DNA-binding transcriptional LysR family regulator